MKIGPLFKVWIGLKTQDEDLFTLGIGLAVLRFGLAKLECNLCLNFRWHSQAKIELGCALHTHQQKEEFWFSYVTFVLD